MQPSILKTKILMVEDNQSLSENISELLRLNGYEITGIYETAEEAKNMMISSPPDVALIDIKLKGNKSGIELASELRAEINIPIIFITSASGREVVEKVKHIKPDGFIVKPFTKESLITAIELAFENFKSSDFLPKSSLVKSDAMSQEIFIRENGWLKKIQINEIHWIRAEGTYTHIFVNGKQYTLRNTVKEVMSKLPEHQFIRVHKSFIINLYKIDAFNANAIRIEEVEIPIGRNYYQELIKTVNKITN